MTETLWRLRRETQRQQPGTSPISFTGICEDMWYTSSGTKINLYHKHWNYNVLLIIQTKPSHWPTMVKILSCFWLPWPFLDLLIFNGDGTHVGTVAAECIQKSTTTSSRQTYCFLFARNFIMTHNTLPTQQNDSNKEKNGKFSVSRSGWLKKQQERNAQFAETSESLS